MAKIIANYYRPTGEFVIAENAINRMQAVLDGVFFKEVTCLEKQASGWRPIYHWTADEWNDPTQGVPEKVMFLVARIVADTPIRCSCHG